MTLHTTISCLAILFATSFVQLHAAPIQAKLAFEGPAGVDMPAWVHISLPQAESLSCNMRYPFDDQPWNFRWISFEVTHAGQPLPKLTQTKQNFDLGGIVVGSAAPPTSPKNRFPLHLHYRFSEPGVYRVRCLVFDPMDFDRRNEPVAISDWMELQIHPFSVEQRKSWLEQQEGKPPEDVGLLVGDYLPSLLARPDEQVLPTVLNYIYHTNDLVQRYAVNSLYYYDDDVVRREILALIRKKGCTDYLAHFLSWRRDLFQPVGHDLVKALIPFLKSNSPVISGGTLQALAFLQAHYSWTEHPDVPRQIEQAVSEATPHIISLDDRRALQPLCLFLGTIKSDTSRELLWQLSAKPSVKEQALICLCWIADKRDMVRLTQKLMEQDASVGSLPYHLRRAYGADAIPYLKEALQKAPLPQVRLYCAQELARENCPEAILFFRNAIESKCDYHDTAVQMIRDQFHIKPNWSDQEIIKFLDEKLQGEKTKVPH